MILRAVVPPVIIAALIVVFIILVEITQILCSISFSSFYISNNIILFKALRIFRILIVNPEIPAYSAVPASKDIALRITAEFFPWFSDLTVALLLIDYFVTTLQDEFASYNELPIDVVCEF